MRSGAVLFLILVSALMVPPALAAGNVKLDTDQQEYYFVVGSSADIPITVTSTYSDILQGTIRLSTEEQLQQPGLSMISTQNRVYPCEVKPGTDIKVISVGTSATPRIYRLHITYYYDSPSPVEATLPEILVHFVSDPSQAKNTPSHMTSSSAPGTGKVPTSSSVQISQQSASARQQAGNDGSQGSIQNNQMNQDTNALREQLLKEKDAKDQEQNAFEGALENDMLLASVNESLYSQGFTRQSLDARAKGSNAGTFSILYRKGADGLAIITGSMEHGDVSSVLGQSNTALNTTQPLAENTTFQSYDLMAKEREFAMSETLFERSLTGSIVNMTYTDKDGKKAYLNSTTFLSNITCISFAYETGPVQSPRVLLILAIAAAMIGAGWVVYRRYFKGKMMKMQPDPTVEAPGMAFDHREKARILLEKAETAYRNQDYPTAYGLAGQAIRLFLAYEYGARTEMTNSEILAFMSKKGGETGTVKKILGTCSDIGFARGIPSEGEFDLLVRQVREIVGIS